MVRAVVMARVNSRLGLWPVNRPGAFTARFSGQGPSRGFSREHRAPGQCYIAPHARS